MTDYADLEKRLRECVDPKRPTYGEALRAEAADALAALRADIIACLNHAHPGDVEAAVAALVARLSREASDRSAPE